MEKAEIGFRKKKKKNEFASDKNSTNKTFQTSIQSISMNNYGVSIKSVVMNERWHRQERK